MRVTNLLFSLCLDVALSASVRLTRESTSGGLERRQIDLPAAMAALFGDNGKVADPPGAAPRRQTLQSPSKLKGAKRVKIRSGPYKVPNMSKRSAMTGHAGMLENYPDSKIEKPCAGECTILRQQAGLEYANGSNANIDTGMWLHHMVHFNIGPSRWDAAGYDIRCMPHLALGTSPTKSERYFTSGNERSPFDFNPGGVNLSSGSGYQLRQTDKFGYLIELMNMNMEDQIVYLTMVYDYLEGPLPKGWTEIKVIWLDANQCGSSEVTPWQETGTFRLESEPPWSPNFEGKIVSAIGHLHDGGVQIDIRFSANNSLCKSATVYSESPEYIYRGTSMGDDKVAKDHISSMSGCKPSDLSIRELKKDQAWFVGGNYDYDKRQGNLERGVQADIMALALVLVAVPPGPVKPPIIEGFNDVGFRSVGF